MDVGKIRLDFPLFQTKLKGKPIIYFDNACQALRPNSVIKAVNDYYRKYSACGGDENCDCDTSCEINQ